MSTDLLMLVYTAILCVALAFPYTLALIAKLGPRRAVSYPQPGDDNLPGWARRAKRAHLNLVENLAPFAVAVLAVQVLGKADAVSALGATIFFWARLVQAGGHILAVPGLRSAAWFVSLAGLAMAFSRLF